MARGNKRVFSLTDYSFREGIKAVVALAQTRVRRRFVRARNFSEYRAQRKPTLLFVLPVPQFKFSVKAPSFEPLFQLSPRMKTPLFKPLSLHMIYDSCNHMACKNLFLHPLIIRPISFIFSAARPYCLILRKCRSLANRISIRSSSSSRLACNKV